MGVGRRIAYYLERNEMQQKELAEKINMDTSVLNRIINERRPIRSEELAAISKVFGITMDKLAGLSSDLPNGAYNLSEPIPEPPPRSEEEKRSPLAAALPVVGSIIKTLSELSPAKQEQAASYIAFLAQDDKKA